ncbi:amidohydrolase [Microlunatus endophyticus]|uniref:Amidohydrolase n=1 Tax=Microlunatus endophyticus TaxID=1716077 RepID=A0A917W533_9ACTN|nr:amidohydrolase [Microlunatus endophyticus]GGL69868.1 amidohydrolase [Microlunatus endophyticus]
MPVRIFRNARIYTGDPSQPVVSALAAQGERLVAVGDESSVREAVTGPVELIDLDGACVLPGLYDAHIHTANLARDLTSLDLRGAGSLAEALQRVTDFLPQLPDGVWLSGGRWDSNRWDVPVQPNRQALDSVCPDRPADLSSIDGHTHWVNTAALRAAGIDRGTPDPIGGEIVRDLDGEPTGILREAATGLLGGMAAASDTRDLADRLLDAQVLLLSVGLTSVHDIDSEDCRAAYLSLRDAGKLKIRVHKAIPVTALELAIEEGRCTGDGDDWFRTGPVKLFSDGALGSHTCHMSEPFPDGSHGIAVTPYEDLVRLVGRANSAGIAVATHAIGDQAATLVLDAYQQAATGGLRNRIEHAQHLQWADIKRMAQLGVVASMQPTHCTSDIDLVRELLGDRDIASYAWRSVLDAGAPLAFGSDAPVEEPNPFYGIHAAVSRMRRDGTPPDGFQPEQRLSVSEAISAFTLGSAYAAGEERDKGALTVGRLADFIVVDTDPYLSELADLSRTRVRASVVGGEVRSAH